MIRAALGCVALTGALGVAGHLDQQDEVAAAQRYCEMVHAYETDRRNRPQVDRSTRFRPGWPIHRADIDCREYGFSLAYSFSKH